MCAPVINTSLRLRSANARTQQNSVYHTQSTRKQLKLTDIPLRHRTQSAAPAATRHIHFMMNSLARVTKQPAAFHCQTFVRPFCDVIGAHTAQLDNENHIFPLHNSTTTAAAAYLIHKAPSRTVHSILFEMPSTLLCCAVCHTMRLRARTSRVD